MKSKVSKVKVSKIGKVISQWANSIDDAARKRITKRVLDMFDAAAQFAEREKHTEVPQHFVQQTIGIDWTGWPVESYRAVLSAALAEAPVNDLAGICAESTKFIEWLSDFQLECRYEREHPHDLGGFKAWRAGYEAAKLEAAS